MACGVGKAFVLSIALSGGTVLFRPVVDCEASLWEALD